MGQRKTLTKPQRTPREGSIRRIHLPTKNWDYSQISVSAVLSVVSDEYEFIFSINIFKVKCKRHYKCSKIVLCTVSRNHFWDHSIDLPCKVTSFMLCVHQQKTVPRRYGKLSGMRGRAIKTLPGAMTSSGPSPSPTMSGSAWVWHLSMPWIPCGSWGLKKVDWSFAS